MSGDLPQSPAPFTVGSERTNSATYDAHEVPADRFEAVLLDGNGEAVAFFVTDMDAKVVALRLKQHGDLLAAQQRIGGHCKDIAEGNDPDASLDAIEHEVTAAIAKATEATRAYPRACILTGEEGEAPDDCTTHDHDEATS